MEGNFELQVKQAIKCLQDQINTLKQEVETLKEQKAQLQAENTQLKKQLASKKTTNKTMHQVFTAPLEEKSIKQQQDIDRLTELIKHKDNYIRKLELSLAKYNFTEVELLKRINGGV